MTLSPNKMRRGLAIVVVALGGLTATAPLARAASGPAPLEPLGRTVWAALGAAGAERAIEALGTSLALQRARQRIEAHAERDAARAKRLREEIASGEISDPSSLPAASAGSNGSYTPGRASARDEALFARTRAAAKEGSTAILLSGIALAPPSAPEAIQGAIDNANTIVGRPYVWGGGHQSWYSAGYDCSGAVSFALFGGALIPRPLTSSELMHWGAPGPGRWITVYANPGHTFVEIAGLRFDTVGNERGTGPRWHLAVASGAGYAVRHPPGL